jgi:fructan beta-fructosidase
VIFVFVNTLISQINKELFFFGQKILRISCYDRSSQLKGWGIMFTSRIIEFNKIHYIIAVLSSQVNQQRIIFFFVYHYNIIKCVSSQIIQIISDRMNNVTGNIKQCQTIKKDKMKEKKTILVKTSGKRGTVKNPVKPANFDEQFRPQFHFTPEANWMNDPNGMVYYDGEYHLFYQYYPNDTVWGPMHWGHAVSTDLVHWEELPVALYPDELGYIFSGSAVIDINNTSGLGTEENPPMVAIFTYHDRVGEDNGENTFQTQGLAYSLDRGRTFIKYSDNPVLQNPGIADFRDPKVFYHEESNRWIMILAADDRVKLYSSPNLKDWTFESDFGMNAGAHGGVWECPDLFPFPISGSHAVKWVMLVSINPGGPNGGSATQYFVGDFDGHTFVNDGGIYDWLDWGRDNYAGVTWSNIPQEDGRRLFIGWMSNWEYAEAVPTTTWRGAMTVPRELLLEEDDNRYSLISKPITQLEGIRTGQIMQTEEIIVSGEVEIPVGNIPLNQSELILNLQRDENAVDAFGIILENDLDQRLVISYSAGGFHVDRSKAGPNDFSDAFAGTATAPYAIGKEVNMHLFIDASSVELFIDHGRLAITELVFPSGKFTVLKIFSTAGNIQIKSSVLYELSSIW